MTAKTVRRSLTLSPDMRERLRQVAASRGRGVREADLIREALTHFLDAQTDLIGSRRHFTRSLQEHLTRVERQLSFQLNLLVYLLLTLTPVEDADAVLEDAILAAHTQGETLLAQIAAVRALTEDDRR